MINDNRNTDEPLFIKVPLNIPIEEIEQALWDKGFTLEKTKNNYRIGIVPMFLRKQAS